jgi:flagellar motor component MotA
MDEAQTKILAVRDRLSKLNELSAQRDKNFKAQQKAFQNDVRKIFKGKSMAQANSRELTDLFELLATNARKQGLLFLEYIVPLVDDEFLKQALCHVVDGEDPENVSAFLNNRKSRLLDNLATRLGVIMTGIRAIQRGANPRTVRTCCEALL